MSFFEDGFLGLDLEDDTPTMKAIDISILSTALTIQILIGITAMYNISNNFSINRILIILFLSSLCFACTFTIGGLMDDVGGDHIEKIIEFVTVVSFGFFFQSLLWTFVFRLYITFKESDHPISPKLIVVFIGIIFIELAGWIVFCALFVFMEDTNPLISFSLGLSLLFLYIIGSGLAVIGYISKLSNLANRERTLINLNLSARHIELDRAQQSITTLSAKYLLLFAIAIGSTILMNISSYFVNIGSGLRSPILALDMCINTFCIFLQFSFAGNQYRKCCGYCHAKCSGRMALRTKNGMYQHAMTMSREMQAKDLYDSENDGQTDREDEEHLPCNTGADV